MFSQIGTKLVLIGPAADDPAELLQIYKHDRDYKFIAPKDLPFASPGQPVEFIDGLDGEKIFVDSHKGKAKRFKVEY